METQPVCNICLQTGSYLLVRIGETWQNNVKLITKLNSCVPEVKWDETFMICDGCTAQLATAYSFRNICITSNASHIFVKAEPALSIVQEELNYKQESISSTQSTEEYMCNFCNQTYFNKSDFHTHVEVHTTTSCMLCKIIFNTTSDLKMHLDKIHPTAESNLNEDNFVSLSDISDSESKTTPNVPAKSKEKYEIIYKWFMNWLNKNKVASFSEKVMMAYFVEISGKFKPTTLWTHYSMLRTTLAIHNDVNIGLYSKLKAFLKRQSVGYQPKKSKTLTSSQIDRFIKEAPDSKHLLTKVALIMGIMGACRRIDLYQMSVSDFRDLGSAVIITICSNMKTKETRCFTITGNFYSIFKKYANLRPKHVKGTYFFLNYQKEKCTIQRVGINKFGCMGKEVAKYLNLLNPELYTGHCFRKTSAEIFIDQSVDITSLRDKGMKSLPQWQKHT